MQKERRPPLLMPHASHLEVFNSTDLIYTIYISKSHLEVRVGAGGPVVDGGAGRVEGGVGPEPLLVGVQVTSCVGELPPCVGRHVRHGLDPTRMGRVVHQGDRPVVL